MNTKGLFLLLVALGSFANCFAQDDIYFYTQFGDYFNGNGNDIISVDDELLICGTAKTSSTSLWGGFTIKVDEFGNKLSANLHEDSIYLTYRKIVALNDKCYTFGWQFFDNDTIQTRGNMRKIDIASFETDTVYNFGVNAGAYTANLINGSFYLGGSHFLPQTAFQDNPYFTIVDTLGNQSLEVIYEDFEYDNLLWDIQPINENELMLFATTEVFWENNIGHANVTMMRVDSIGNILWQKTINFGWAEYVIGAFLLNDGILVAYEEAFVPLNVKDTKFIKYSYEGDYLWESEGIPYCGISGIEMTKDSFIVAAGCSRLNTPSTDAALFKYDLEGNLLWTRTFGFPYGYETLYGMTIDEHNRIIATGRTETNGVGADILLIKTNCMGLMTYPEAQFNFEEISDSEIVFENLSQYVYPDSIDGGHYLWNFGDDNFSSDINPSHTYETIGAYEVTLTAVVCQDTSVYSTCVYLEENSLCCAEVEALPVPAFSLNIEDSLSISLANGSGNLYQEYTNGAKLFWDFGDGNTSAEFSPNHTFTEANYYDVTLSIIFCGDTTSVFETVKIGEPVGVEALGNYQVKIYPNPATTSITIEYKLENSKTLFLYNSLGQLIQETRLNPTSNSKTLITEHFTEGIYYWQLGRENGKLVIM